MTLAFFIKTEILTFDFNFNCLFAVVSVGKTVVRVDVAVCVGSIGVGEGGVMVGSIAVVTSPDSRVVHPGIGLRVSLSAGLSNGLSLSLLHSDGRFLLNSSGGGGGHNSGGYKTAMGAGDKSSSIVGASSSIGHHGRMGDGQSVGVVGVGVGEDPGSGVGE